MLFIIFFFLQCFRAVAVFLFNVRLIQYRSSLACHLDHLSCLTYKKNASTASFVVWNSFHSGSGGGRHLRVAMHCIVVYLLYSFTRLHSLAHTTGRTGRTGRRTPWLGSVHMVCGRCSPGTGTHYKTDYRMWCGAKCFRNMVTYTI